MKRRGRRPIDGKTADKVIRVRVTAAQRLELRRVADENGTGMSGVIREAVSEFCSDSGQRSPFQRSNKIPNVPHTSDMANQPSSQPPNPPQNPRPPQPPQPSGPSQPPNTPDTGTHLPKP